MNIQRNDFFNLTEDIFEERGKANSPAITSPCNEEVKPQPSVCVALDWLAWSFPCDLKLVNDYILGDHGETLPIKKFDGSTNDLYAVNLFLKDLNLDFDKGIREEGFFQNYLNSITWNVPFASDGRVQATKFFYNGYQKNGNVFTQNKHGQNTSRFELSGAACRDFEFRNKNIKNAWNRLLSDICLVGGRFSRVDVYVDLMDCEEEFIEELTKILSGKIVNSNNDLLMEVFSFKLQNGEFTSRGKKIKGINEKNHDNLSYGTTWYVGSSRSDKFCRIYNKKAEQVGKGFACVHKSWIRLEFQLGHDQADLFVTNLLDNWSSPSVFVSKFLNDWITFKSRNDGDCLSKNKNRWPVWPVWEKILNTIEKSTLRLPKYEQSIISRKAEIFVQNNFRSLGALYLTDSEATINLINNSIKCGLEEIKEFIDDRLLFINYHRLLVDKMPIDEKTVDKTLLHFKMLNQELDASGRPCDFKIDDAQLEKKSDDFNLAFENVINENKKEKENEQK